MYTKICDKCKKDFKASHPNSRYCTPCKTIVCKVCGITKKIQPTQVTAGQGFYCGHKCAAIDSGQRHKKNGYWVIKAEGHPKAYDSDFYYEHILVMEKHLGRYLDTKKEIVHHKDGNRKNNDLSNLELMTRSQHSLHHWPSSTVPNEEVGIDHKQFAKHVQIKKPVKIVNGYAYVFEPENPMASKHGYVMRSHKVMAKHLRRPLTANEGVMHKNGDRADDRLENLELVKRNRTKLPTEKYVDKRKGFTIEHGYIVIWHPGHPMARKTGYIAEHRLVMAQHLGRMLTKDEHVHHINGNRMDNKLENLQLVTNKEHFKLRNKR